MLALSLILRVRVPRFYSMFFIRRHSRQASSVLGLHLEPEEEGLITGFGDGE